MEEGDGERAGVPWERCGLRGCFAGGQPPVLVTIFFTFKQRRMYYGGSF